MTRDNAPLRDLLHHSAHSRLHAGKNGRAWRISLAAATSLAVMCGLTAAACATGASARVGTRATAKPRVRYIGAYVGMLGHNAGRAAQWNAAYSEVGPLQSDKIFYGTNSKIKPLPPTFIGSLCDELQHQPVCVIAYRTASKKTLQSFVESMPKSRSRPVIMVYWQEPELRKSAISAREYTKEFDLRSEWVRQAAKARHLAYVKIAMDSSTYGYAPGQPGYGCSYLPAASYVDYYLADVYEHRLTGLANVVGFQRWTHCTASKRKPQGIAEYGLGVCTKTGTRASTLEREKMLARDAAYLAKNFPHLFLWQYWWSQISGSRGKCDHSWFPPNSVIGTEWRKIAAGTVED